MSHTQEQAAAASLYDYVSPVKLAGFALSFGKSIYDCMPSPMSLVAYFRGTGAEDDEPEAVAERPKFILSPEAAQEAVRDGRWADLESCYKANPEPNVAKAIRTGMLETEAGRQALAVNPGLAATVLADSDAGTLRGLDLDDLLGERKSDVVAGATMRLAGKYPPPDKGALNPQSQRDDEAFAFFAGTITKEQWNDPATGLGTRVCQQLWQNQGYDQICGLVRAGVDTTVAARATGSGSGGGLYSGFVQPLQHIIQGSLRDISELEASDNTLSVMQKKNATGAKKIFQALEETKTAVTVTDWKDVTGSEMITQFKDAPGTIWGFEDIRLPFVQAAHDTDHGAQPLRMMEIWEAVEQALTPAVYETLLEDPEGAVDGIVATGLQALEAGMKDTKPSKKKKYADLNASGEEAIKQFKVNFQRDARAFLLEWAAQMPKTSFERPAVDASGQPRADKARVSELAGIQSGKLGGGMACKAGLWWAKKDKKPVYYCLDGIKMEEVAEYKKVKNKAIEDYISSPTGDASKRHDEVITFVELREILKKWDELNDDEFKTIKLVLGGRVFSDEEAAKWAAEWQKKLAEADRLAGRAPAPPRDVFVHELAALDPGLMGELEAGEEGDKDARDIVRKAGYLVKIAKRRPDIVLKYVISKCGVLLRYKLIPSGLIEKAKALHLLAQDNPPAREAIEEATRQVVAEAEKSHAKFKGPLMTALAAYPLTVKQAK